MKQLMENKTIFKTNDRVFDAMFGWGFVININQNDGFPIRCEFNSGQVSYLNNGKISLTMLLPTLSFTEYDFVNGGFSQVRPIEIPNRGQIVWVRDSHTGKWVISHFLRMFDGKFITSNTIDDINYSTWNYLTTQNPYENE